MLQAGQLTGLPLRETVGAMKLLTWRPLLLAVLETAATAERARWKKNPTLALAVASSPGLTGESLSDSLGCVYVPKLEKFG